MFRQNVLRRASQLVFACAIAAVCAACSGSGGNSGYNPPNGGGNGYTSQCDPGTSVQTANPAEFATGVPTNLSSVTIVANGNANALYQTYGSWSVILQSSYGPIYGGQLSLVSDPSGPHPFPSDYYYASSISGGLPQGQSFTVQLVNNAAYCNPVSIGSFST